MLRHLIPRLHFTVYSLDGVPRFAVWRQWLNWCWDVYDFPIPA